MNDLISVIVPVYNVEKYLKRCVGSILAQTYQNIEVILVDDGSTDGSGAICDEFAENDERVKVIHKENGGVSQTRNVGLSAARGKFITFCDSDDWMASSILYDAKKTHDDFSTDIVVWGYYSEFVDDNESTISCKKYIPEPLICQKDGDNTYLTQEGTMGLIGYVWNKLYCSEIVRGLSFPENITLYEDFLFNKDTFVRANSVVFIDTIGTHYIQRGQSLGTKFHNDFYELKLELCRAKETLWKSYGIDEDTRNDLMNREHYEALVSTIRMLSRTNHFINNTERIRMIKELLHNKDADNILRDYWPTSTKDRVISWLLQFKLYAITVALFNINK